MPLRLYRVVAACLRRLHCMCIECYRFHCVLTETVHTELPRRPLRSRGAPTASIGVCRAMTRRSHCVVSKANTIVSKQLDHCHPHGVFSFIMAVERQHAALFLAYMQVQQVQDEANVGDMCGSSTACPCSHNGDGLRESVTLGLLTRVPFPLFLPAFSFLFFPPILMSIDAVIIKRMAKVCVTPPLSLLECRFLKINNVELF